MSEEDHRQVINALRTNKRVRAGVALDRLRQIRNTADYDVQAAAIEVKGAGDLADEIRRLCSPDW
jgi:hypothetical protein